MESNTIVRVYQDATEVLVPSAAFFTDQLAATAADRIAVAADKAATHADKLAADADAVATAADRVQTGIDRAAVAADKTATHSDKLAADADAVATAADRAATHSDKLAADADATATAADRTVVHADRLAADNSAASAAASDASAAVHDAVAGLNASTSSLALASALATQAAIQALIDGYPGSAGQTIPVATRTAMKAISNPAGSFRLHEAGYAGDFVALPWDDIAPDAANQTIEGFYYRSTATPAMGFKRQTPVITPFHFGAVGTGSTDDLAKLQAFNDFIYAPSLTLANSVTTNGSAIVTMPSTALLYAGMAISGTGVSVGHTILSVDSATQITMSANASASGTVTLTATRAPRKEYADWTGNFGKSGQLFMGPSVADGTDGSGQRWNVGGELRIVDLAPVTESIRWRNLNAAVWYGRPTVTGIGGASFASRPCGVGHAFENCFSLKFTGGIRADNFWFMGIYTAVDSNDEIDFGKAICLDCGSGYPGSSLTANWSAPSNTGSASSTSQRTVLTVDTLPPAALTTYAAIGAQQVAVRIAGEPYYVQAIDWGAGTITIGNPWLNPAAGSGGTLEYIFGGGLLTSGSDGGVIEARGVHIARCGIGVGVGALYGIKITGNISNCGIGVAIGKTPSSSCIGWDVAPYIEGCSEEFVMFAQPSGSCYGYFNSGFEPNLAKYWSRGLAVRDGSGVLSGNELGSTTTGPACTIAYKGKVLVFDKQNLTSTYSGLYSDQRRPEKITTYFLDGKTIQLSPSGSGAENLLFGFTGGTRRYIGTGPNSVPTSNIIYACPTQAYTSAVRTSGSAVVTMASTAGMIAGMPITGTGIPASTTILSVDSATQITLSANATSSGTATVTVTGSINGAFANVTFNDFDGPPEIAAHFTDTAQLVWIVRCTVGKMRHGWVGVDQLTNGSKTLTTSGATPAKMTQYLDVPITGNRTVTLPAPGKMGRQFRIVRSANATGAFNLNINTSSAVLLKALSAASMSAVVEDDGTEYRLTAAGSL